MEAAMYIFMVVVGQRLGRELEKFKLILHLTLDKKSQMND